MTLLPEQFLLAGQGWLPVAVLQLFVNHLRLGKFQAKSHIAAGQCATCLPAYFWRQAMSRIMPSYHQRLRQRRHQLQPISCGGATVACRLAR